MSGLIACTLAPASTLMVTAGFCAKASSAISKNTTTYPYTILRRYTRLLLQCVGRARCVRAVVIVSHAVGPISVTMLTKVGGGPGCPQAHAQTYTSAAPERRHASGLASLDAWRKFEPSVCDQALPVGRVSITMADAGKRSPEA